MALYISGNDIIECLSNGTIKDGDIIKFHTIDGKNVLAFFVGEKGGNLLFCHCRTLYKTGIKKINRVKIKKVKSLTLI